MKGYTLVETVLFITLLTLMVTTLLRLFPHLFLQPLPAMVAIPAAFLTDGKVEKVLADYYHPGRGMAYLIDDNYPMEPLDHGQTLYTRLNTVQQSGDRYTCQEQASRQAHEIKCLTVRLVQQDNGQTLAQTRLLLWPRGL